MKSSLDYVRQHWQGQSSLALSFWINFLLLFVVLNVLERFTLPPYLRGETLVTTAVIVFFLIVRLVIYPWQAIGVIRACERCLQNNDNRTWAIVAEGVVVFSLAVTMIIAFSSYQSLLGYQRSLHPPVLVTVAPNYSLDLIAQDTLIHVQGPLEIGITHQVSQLIAAHPQVVGIVLDSDGGQIYEARGLARLIRDNALVTYSLDICASSCTTAFVAGTKRTLGNNAKLGFHQYKSYTVLPVIDIDEEHATDIALFKAQSIAPEFLQKIFEQPPDKMWWPQEDELIDAGVIHASGFVFDADSFQ